MKIGEQISVINDIIKGLIVGIEGNFITIESAEGFLLTYRKNELVVYTMEMALDTDIPRKDSFPIGKSKASKRITEIDLHHKGKKLPTHEILAQQIQQFKKALNNAIAKQQSELTVIHGYGEGRLKHEIERILQKNKIPFSEAPYVKYGQDAATIVFLKGIKKIIQ